MFRIALALGLLGSLSASAAVNLNQSAKNQGWFLTKSGPDLVVRVCKPGETVTSKCATQFADTRAGFEAFIAALAYDTGSYGKTEAAQNDVRAAIVRTESYVAANQGTPAELDAARQRLVLLKKIDVEIAKALAVRALFVDETIQVIEDFQAIHGVVTEAIRTIMSVLQQRTCTTLCSYDRLVSIGDPFGKHGPTYKREALSHAFLLGAWQLEVEGWRHDPKQMGRVALAACQAKLGKARNLASGNVVCN